MGRRLLNEMRRATRKIHLDKNHHTVVSELRGHGIEVIEVLEPCDLILRSRDGYISFCEVKPEDGNTTYRRTQLSFMAATKYPIFIARTGREAMQKLERRETLSQGQKDALAGFLALNPAVKFNHQKIERILNT